MRNAMWQIFTRRLQRSSRPLLVGPFKSELGFEALYWVAFVQSLGIAPERIIPVTRGGAATLYGVPHGVEIYDLRDPKDIRIENMLQHGKTGMLKQNTVTPFDRALIKDAAKAAGLTSYHVLHPSWMYQILRPFWEGQTGLEWVFQYLTKLEVVNGQKGRMLHALSTPALPEGLTLPKQFCTARFYARTTFPMGDPVIQCVKACLAQVAQGQPVVLLNPGVHADEHVDIATKKIIGDIPNVIRLSDMMKIEPRTNLAVQAAVIARSQGFIGTYGGLAQLALRLGKPSVSFYLNWQGTAIAHKQLSEALSLQTGVSFLTLKLTDIPLLKAVAPDLQFAFGSSQARQAQQAAAKEPAPEVSTALHVEATRG